MGRRNKILVYFGRLSLKIVRVFAKMNKLIVLAALIGACMAGIPRHMDKREANACAAGCPAACAPACVPVCCAPPAPPPPPPPPPPCPAVCVQACVPTCPAPCCPQKK